VINGWASADDFQRFRSERLIGLGPAGGAYRAPSPASQEAARASVSALPARFDGALPTGIWTVTASA
jgi:hypothetical protein